MRIMCRYLSLFLSLVFFTLPAGAGPGTVSGYGNFTGEPGWNVTQNTSETYFYSGSGLVCVATGEAGGIGEEIYADGLEENVTYLTDSPESELFPVWTADGTHIMYTTQRVGSENSESYVMKANGSQIERIDIGEENLTVFNDIDPNGTELVITRSIDSQPGLYLVNLESGTISPIADDPDKSEGWGAWCRLGRKIIYTQESAGSPSQLWIVDRDGSNRHRLGTSENVGTGKDWCPLGLKVLYSARNAKEKPDLWAIDWYGTNQTQLTDTPYGEWNPSFSPDGKRIVYVSDEGGKPEIWLRDIEGNYRIRLTNNSGIGDPIPRWSPEGSKIVFTAHNLQNTTDSSTINDSNSNHANLSNNSIMTDLDIAVIKLENIPAVSPMPEVTSVKISSESEVPENGAVNISITVRNQGRNSSEGYIWVSFPDGGELEKVEGTGSSMKIYPRGSLIQGKNGEMPAQYPLIEFVEYGWSKEQEESLNMTLIKHNGIQDSEIPDNAILDNEIVSSVTNNVTAGNAASNAINNATNTAGNNETISNGTEEITFFLRTALKNDLTGTYTEDPQFSEDLDQQGMGVYKYSVYVP